MKPIPIKSFVKLNVSKYNFVPFLENMSYLLFRLLASQNSFGRSLACNNPLKPRYRESKKHVIVFLTAGQCEWCEERRITGWYDAKLTEAAMRRADKISRRLLQEEIDLGHIFTSELDRTFCIAKEIRRYYARKCCPEPEITSDWRLNERHWGDLTGDVEADVICKYGEKQINSWAHHVTAYPPPISEANPHFHSVTFNQVGTTKVYTESLNMLNKRCLDFWHDTIVNFLRRTEKPIMIIGHRGSLKVLLGHLEKVPMNVRHLMTLPAAIPFVYTLDSNLEPIRMKSMKFLGSFEEVEEAKENYYQKCVI